MSLAATTTTGSFGRGRRRALPIGLPDIPDIVLFVLLVLVFRVSAPTYTQIAFGSADYVKTYESASQSNLFNQLQFTVLAALATIPVLRNPRVLRDYGQLLYALWFLIALCVMSALWATHPDISIRRSMLLVLVAWTLVASIACGRSAVRILMIFYLVMWMSLLLNAAGFAFPGSFERGKFFVGAVAEKNLLGTLSVIGIFVGITARAWLRSRLWRYANVLYITLWLAILVLTVAKTSIALVVLAPLMLLGLIMAARLLRLSLTLTVLMLGATVVVAYGLLTLGLGFTQSDILGLFVRDTGLTGRDAIWVFMLASIRAHWVLGYGYGSFWSVGDDSPNTRALTEFVRLLTQGHNGYLDLVAVVGVIGIVLLAGLLLQYLQLLDAVRRRSWTLCRFAGLALCFVLVHNMTESSFVRALAPSWIFFIFAMTLMAKSVLEARDPERRAMRASDAEGRTDV